MGGLLTGRMSRAQPLTPEEEFFRACHTDDADKLREALAVLSGEQRQRSSSVSGASSDPRAIPSLVHGMRDSEGRTGLMVASKSGANRVVRVLLELGARVNRRHETTRTTALHYAAGWGQASTCELLLDSGADPTIISAKGFTALDLARVHERTAVVRAIETKTALFFGWLKMERSTPFQAGLGAVLGESVKDAVKSKLGGDWRDCWVVVTKMTGSRSGASPPAMLCPICQTLLRSTTGTRLKCTGCNALLAAPPAIPTEIVELAIYNSPEHSRPTSAYPILPAVTSVSRPVALHTAAGTPEARSSAGVGLMHAVDVRVARPPVLSLNDLNELKRNKSGGNAYGVVDPSASGVIWAQSRLSSVGMPSGGVAGTRPSATAPVVTKKLRFCALEPTQVLAFSRALVAPPRNIASEAAGAPVAAAAAASASRRPSSSIPVAAVARGPVAPTSVPIEAEAVLDEDEADAIQAWTCGSCTFLNRVPTGAVEICAICETPRAETGAVPPPSVPLRRIPPPPSSSSAFSSGFIDDVDRKDLIPAGQAVAAPPQLAVVAAYPLDEDDDEIFMCPITNSLMEDPVVIADGTTYERRAIQEWFDAGHLTSPMTGLAVEHTTLAPNIALKQAIEKHVRKQRALQQQASSALSLE